MSSLVKLFCPIQAKMSEKKYIIKKTYNLLAITNKFEKELSVYLRHVNV